MLVTGSICARRRQPCSMFLGGRAFSSTAAHVWNSLPTAVQSSESLDILRHRLKTELFVHSYNWHRACQTTLLLRDSLSPSLQLFAVAATLMSIDYNVAMTFILNNNNNKNTFQCRLLILSQHVIDLRCVCVFCITLRKAFFCAVC